MCQLLMHLQTMSLPSWSKSQCGRQQRAAKRVPLLPHPPPKAAEAQGVPAAAAGAGAVESAALLDGPPAVTAGGNRPEQLLKLMMGQSLMQIRTRAQGSSASRAAKPVLLLQPPPLPVAAATAAAVRVKRRMGQGRRLLLHGRCGRLQGARWIQKTRTVTLTQVGLWTG